MNNLYYPYSYESGYLYRYGVPITLCRRKISYLYIDFQADEKDVDIIYAFDDQERAIVRVKFYLDYTTTPYILGDGHIP